MPHVLQAFLASACIAASITAQRTVWTVNSFGGPGVFVQIQPAIDAASPGDRIVVFGGGPYAPFTLTKGVDIEALHGAVVRDGAVVRQVPAGQQAQLVGMQIQGLPGGRNAPFDPSGPAVLIDACHGSVLLHGLQLDGGRGADTPASPGAVVVDSCAVLLVDCTITAGPIGCRRAAPGLVLRGASSGVAMQRSTVRGGSGAQGTDPCASDRPRPAIESTGASLLVVNSTLLGADGLPEREYAGACLSAQAGAAAIEGSGEVVVTSASTLVPGRGGAGCCGAFCAPCRCTPASDGVAIALSSGNASVTRDCVVRGVLGTASLVLDSPFLQVPAIVPRNSTRTLVIRAGLGSNVALLFDVDHAHARIAGIAGSFLLTAGAVTIAQLAMARVDHSVSFQVPNDAQLADRQFYLQVVELDGSLRLSLSNVGDVRVR